MTPGAEYFLKHTLGEDFYESLQKVELWKPGTKTTTDHEEIRTALQIVPRIIMALLIKELAPMSISDNKVINLPVSGGEAILTVTKHERDVYSGTVVQANKELTEFKFRSIPGIGLVIMSTFELYDMENLINANQHADPHKDAYAQVQKIIDERLALHDLIGKVVDKKIMEKDAIHQLVLRKLTEMLDTPKEKAKDERAYGMDLAEVDMPKSETPKPEKKKRPLTEFLEKAKKKREYSVVMTKGETVHCPDCGKNIFDGAAFSGCICLGDDMERKVFIKKNEDGIKVRFSKGWDEENIEMLLEVLRKKHG